MALGRVVPARRAIAASSAREGEKARNGLCWIVVSVKSLEKLILDVLLVVDHDSDLKNRCSTGRFRVITIHILSHDELDEGDFDGSDDMGFGDEMDF